MTYFYLEPEVAGGLGENTVIDRSVHPPVVGKLHYILDGWLGDALLESFPCFIVTERAKEELLASGLSGVRFEEAEVTTSDQFKELYPNRQIPKFIRLKAEGKPGWDDFATVPDGRLVVSQRALEVLKGLGISNALVAAFE